MRIPRSMTAFALSLAIWSIWWWLGWGLLSVLGSRRNLVRNALLAPAMGAAASTLLLFELYRLGIPVRICGPVVTAAVLIAAAVLWTRARTPVPLRVLSPFIGLLLVAALLTGWPMLRYGFDWVSYANDDMANYVLLARSELTRGYLSPIAASDITGHGDPGAILWISSILGHWRNGADLTLAWVMSCTGKDGLEVFMPSILAMQLALVAAGGALVAKGRRYRAAAAGGCVLLALSSLVSLGTLYQLIAQVLGLALFAAAAAILMRPRPFDGRGGLVRRALPGAILSAALCICYPETVPLLVGSFGLYHAIGIIRGRQRWRELAGYAALWCGSAVILLNTSVTGMMAYLLAQITGGAKAGTLADVLFPYYLIPSGLAVFWGLHPLASAVSHPSIDVFIVAGALLLASGVAASVWSAWRGDAAGAVSTVMLALGVRLFLTRSDFGLFKLAMFLQPFLLPAMILSWFSIRAGRRPGLVFWTPILLVAVASVRAQQYYVRVSAGAGGASFVEIPFATPQRLAANLKSLASQPRRPVAFSDTSSMVLGKLEEPYLAPSDQYFLSQDYFGLLIPVHDLNKPSAYARFVDWWPDILRPDYLESVRALLRARLNLFASVKFDMHGSPPNTFTVERPRGASEAYTLAATGLRQTILNRSSEASAPDQPVRLVPSEKVRNHLVLISSNLGADYYLAGTARSAGLIAMFQPESDYFLPGHTLSAIGRTLLFQVLNPSQTVRLVVDYTASLKADSQNAIPPANAIGETRVAFLTAGRGSSRMISPPIVPQTIEGRQYVSVDMGAAPQKYVEQRTGLMRAFGTNIPTDQRAITGFVRDISAIGEEEYAALRPPSVLSRFPDDLRNSSLEYGGIYEDGWVSESSFVRLSAPLRPSVLRVKVVVPGFLPQPVALTVTAGGRAIAHADLKLGEADLRIPMTPASGVQRIQLRFDRAGRLPSPDNRPAAALLRSIGFEENSQADIAEAPVAIGDQWYPFETFAGNSFRWVANDAQFHIQTDRPEKGILAIELESGAGLAGKSFPLELRSEREVQVLSAHGGREVLQVPVALHAGNNSFTLHVSGGGLLTPHDPRILNFRVFRLAWLPRP